MPGMITIKDNRQFSGCNGRQFCIACDVFVFLLYVYFSAPQAKYLSLMEDKDYEAVRGERYFTPYDDIAMLEPKENDDGYLSVGEHLKTTSGC